MPPKVWDEITNLLTKFPTHAAIKIVILTTFGAARDIAIYIYVLMKLYIYIYILE